MSSYSQRRFIPFYFQARPRAPSPQRLIDLDIASHDLPRPLLRELRQDLEVANTLGRMVTFDVPTGQWVDWERFLFILLLYNGTSYLLSVIPDLSVSFSTVLHVLWLRAGLKIMKVLLGPFAHTPATGFEKIVKCTFIAKHGMEKLLGSSKPVTMAVTLSVSKLFSLLPPDRDLRPLSSYSRCTTFYTLHS